jgi:hypothetical protein
MIAASSANLAGTACADLPRFLAFTFASLRSSQ